MLVEKLLESPSSPAKAPDFLKASTGTSNVRGGLIRGNIAARKSSSKGKKKLNEKKGEI